MVHNCIENAEGWINFERPVTIRWHPGEFEIEARDQKAAEQQAMRSTPLKTTMWWVKSTTMRTSRSFPRKTQRAGGGRPSRVLIHMLDIWGERIMEDTVIVEQTGYIAG